jgi:hypothetical protein
MYVYPPIVARQRLGKHVLTTTNTRNRRIVGRVISYAVRVLFPRQGRIFGGFVFYAVRVV